MPTIGDRVRGDEIGKSKYNHFTYVKCPDCGKERFVADSDPFALGFTGLCFRCYPKHTPTHDKSPYWKGRWQTLDGYVWLRLLPDDPFYCMASKSGVVAEHRYVMAQQLGRPLTKEEVVHHLPEAKNKGDNRIEVLALHTKKTHGAEMYKELVELRSRNLDLEAELTLLRSQEAYSGRENI